MIPLSVPNINGNEWTYVKECLDSEWVSSAGKYVELFEEKICDFTGAKHAVACVNGTSALHVALQILGVKPGSEVIVPTMTFVAPVNVVHYVGAEPIFMDCDDYYNIDISKTIEFIEKETTFKNDQTFHINTGKPISAVIPVHIFGNAVALEPLLKICVERNIKILEDATESIGSVYRQGELSSHHCGTIGEAGCLSFNGNKIITTGGGGMILTEHPGYAEKARYLTTQAKDDAFRYIHNEIGYNYRLTNIQAAMGVAQLEQLPQFLKSKRKTYQQYMNGIAEISGLKIAPTPEYAHNNHWMVALQIDFKAYGKNREEVMAYLAKHHIQSRPVWHLNHLQKPYRHCRAYRIEKAVDLIERTLNIPCSTGIKDQEINTVIEILANA